MEAFYQKLTKQIVEAVTAEMGKILQETGEEQIYTAALVTDSDCITLFLAVNTLEYLETNSGLESEDKWLPDEWGYSDDPGGPLEKISRSLYEYDEALGGGDNVDEKREAHHRMFFEAVISALEQLKEQKAFGENTENVTCFFSMSDDERAEELENRSAERLNPPDLFEAFLKRFQ